MRLFLKTIGLAGLALCLLLGAPQTARAAQDATIVVEDAPIRASTSQDSTVLEYKKLGSPVRLSSSSRDGWFKIRTSKGAYGWIWQADVLISSSTSDTNAANLDFKTNEQVERKDRSQPWFFIRAGGELLLTFNQNISQRLGLGILYPYAAFGGYGEVSIRVEDNLRLALRAAYSSSSANVTYTSPTNQTATTYSISQSSEPILVGFDADVYRGESWDFGGGLYFGGATNSLTVVATSQPAPDSFTVSQFNFAGLINFTGRYWFSKRWSFITELGMYIAPTTTLKIPNSFNGSSVFLQTDQTPGTVRATEMGPYLTAGLQLAL